MDEGKQRQTWSIASAVLSLMANCHSSKRSFKPADFNPYEHIDERILVTDENAKYLRSMFEGMNYG